MGYLKARLEFVESDKKSGYVAEDVYFTSSSQDTFFQLKYFHNQGLDLISPQDLTFFCNRMKLHKVNLVELDNISAWTRAVFSFKSQLSNMTTVSDKTETFPFSPNFDHIIEKSKRAKEMKQLMQASPTMRGNYYLETLFEIYGITDENPRPELALDLLKKGVKEEHCSACAATLLNTHIDPDRYNGGQPDYDCPTAAGYLVHVFLNAGIFDYCDYGIKSMKLLKFACFCLDTSVKLREYIIKTAKDMQDYALEMQFEPSRCKSTWNDQVIHNLVLFLLFQPDVSTRLYSFCYDTLMFFATSTNQPKIFILLGDLLDPHFFGTKSQHSFEKRMKMYITSKDNNRIMSVLSLVHQRIQDKKLKVKIEKTICYIMNTKDFYTPADVVFLVRYSLMGTSIPLSPHLKDVVFGNYPSSYLTTKQENKVSKGFLSMFDDILLQLRNVLMENEKSSKDSNAGGRHISHSDSSYDPGAKTKKQPPKSTAECTDPRYKWVENFLYSNRVNLEECVKGLDMLTILGYEDFLFPLFTTLNILGDPISKKVALRLKAQYQEREALPLILFYLASDSKGSEKKISTNLHDCLLKLFNKVNILKIRRSRGEEKGSTAGIEPSHEKRYGAPPFSNMCVSFLPKERDFSIFYDNCFLYYRLFRYLLDCNLNSLSQMFLKACQQETQLSLMSIQSLSSVSLRQITLVHKLLATEEQTNKELQDSLFRLLLLRSGSSVDDKLIKIGFINKSFQAEENFTPHLLFLAELAGNKVDNPADDLLQQTLFVDYVLGLVENKKYYSYLSTSPAFEAFALAQFSQVPKAGSENATVHKHSQADNRSADREGSLAVGSVARPRLASNSGVGMEDILASNNLRCPTEFYSSYFSINDIGCLVEQFSMSERGLFEAYVEYPLTHWIKGLAGDKFKEKGADFWLDAISGPDNTSEGDLRDAIGIKMLTDDFYAVTQAYISQLDGTSKVEGNQESGNREEDVPILQSSIAALNPVKPMSELEYLVDYYSVKQFTKKVSSTQQIRVFRSEEIAIKMSRNLIPDYLNQEAVAISEGMILSNRQKCNIIKISVNYLDQLKRISANLEYMNMYSPFVVKFLGLIFDENYESASNSPFVIHFIVDHWECDLLTYCKNYSAEFAGAKEIKKEQFELVYRLLYLCNIILKTDMLPPLLNPQTIMISKTGYPMILFPFFASSYLSPKTYLDNAFRTQTITDIQYFLSPQTDKLLDVTTLILQMKSRQNYSLSSLVPAESEHQQSLVSSMMAGCGRCILLILTGQVPLTSLISKSTTPVQLQAMLSNPSKTSPVLSKLWTALKKKTPPFMKATIEELGNVFANPTAPKLSDLAQLMKSEMGKDVDILSNFVSYNLSIIAAVSFAEESTGLTRNLDRESTDGLGGSPEAPSRKLIFLPLKIAFNGYYTHKFIQSGKFYSGNNLICSISLDSAGSQTNPSPEHPYLIDYHLEESKSLLLKICGSQLQDVTYLIKNPSTLQGKNSTTPAEKKIVFAKFMENSWVQNENVWLNIIKNQFQNDCEDIRSKAFKLEGSFPKNTVSSILYSERSQSLLELFAQLYFSYNKLCMLRSFSGPHILDFFGNNVNWNPFPPIADINIAKMQSQASPTFDTKPSTTITGSDWLILRSQVPTQMVRTVIFHNSISPNSYFQTDLSQFTLRTRASTEDRQSVGNVVTSEQYFNLVRELSIVDAPEVPKYRAIIHYTEGGQFWGWCRHSQPLQGRFYSTCEDFNTVSDLSIYEGQLCASSRHFKYLGYLEKNLPQYFGEYYLNNNLVYKGGIERGVPDGKGQLFNSKGHLMFDGFLQDGFPVSGVFYKLPRIFVGDFTIPAKSNYRFSFKKIDLFIKSLQYENMMNNFSLQGEIRNYTADVKVIRGYFSHDHSLLKGDFYLRSKEGKVYVGEMNESRKEGVGLMILPTGQTILGKWKGNTINGVFRTRTSENSKTQGADGHQGELSRFPPKPLNQNESPEGMHNTSHDLPGGRLGGLKSPLKHQDSQSHFDVMKKTQTFNKTPVEVRGHFEIRGENLLLMDAGSIRFDDGSVYTGGILNNKMSGYGSLKYSSGDHCEGIWKNNQLTGLGFYSTEAFIYEGQFKNSVWHGFGKLSFKTDGRIIKGEWETGRLKYALIDELEPNLNFLQIDRITVKVDDEANFFKSGISELVGTAHVMFKERSQPTTKDGATSPTVKIEQIPGMAAGKDSPQKSEEPSEHVAKSKEKQQSHSTTSVHQFFGVFVKLDEKSSFDGFNNGQIVALGMIVKGTEVIFTGMADSQFNKFFGVKYDHETHTELRGYFNSNLKLNGIGVQLMPGAEYIGNFRKNHKHGLVIKIRDGFTVFVGNYSDDVKNGYGLRFQEEIAVGSIGEIMLGATPRSQNPKGPVALDGLGVKEGVKGVLTEYAYGKLKKIFYALD